MKPGKLRILYLLIIYCSALLYAQDQPQLFINNCRVTIKDSTSLYIDGITRVDRSLISGENIHNEGVLIFGDTLINGANRLFKSSSDPFLSNSQADSTYGTVIFKNSNTSIYTESDWGDSITSVIFNNLQLQTDTLKLLDSIMVLKNLDLNEGNLFLNNNDLFFYDFNDKNSSVPYRRNGALKEDETDSSNIFDNSSGKIRFYHDVDATKVYIKNLGLKIVPVSTLDIIYLQRNHKPLPYIADSSIHISYQIFETDSGNLGTKGTFFIKYLNKYLKNHDQTEENLRLFHMSDQNNRAISHLGNLSNIEPSVETSNININPGIYTLADTACTILPPAKILGDTSVCLGDVIQLENDTTIDSLFYYQWSSLAFPDLGTENDLFINTDTLPDSIYTFQLTVWDYRGCVNTSKQDVRILPLPNIAPFSYNALGEPEHIFCQSDTVFLTDTINKSGDYFWYLGNGDTCSINSPAYVYPQSGTFKPSLRFTNINGCHVLEDLKNITIGLQPVADFYGDTSLCLGEWLYLTNSSKISKNQYCKEFQWNLSDSQWIQLSEDTIITSVNKYRFKTDKIHDINNRNPDLEYLYTDPGNYEVTLQATSALNCSDTDTLNVTILPDVKAVFDSSYLTNVCFGLPSRFVPGMGTTTTNVAYYIWSFGDTAYNITDTVTFTFTKTGFHKIGLTVIGNNGCSNQTFATIFIPDLPHSTFTCDPVCLGTVSSFNYSGSSNEFGCMYHWSFGDSTELISNPGDTVNHLYAIADSFAVSLLVTNKYGCMVTDSQNIYVHPNPESDFYTHNSCESALGNDTIIKNTSHKLPNTIYNWYFSDGSVIPNTYQPKGKLFTPGGYKVILTTETSFANLTCKSSSSDSIYIYINPAPDFKVSKNTTNVCEGQASKFLLNGIGLLHDIDSITWRFGDGDKSFTLNKTNECTYDTSGNFNVHVKVLSNRGCRGEKEKIISIFPGPVAEFTVDPVCLGNASNFYTKNNTSTNIIRFNWGFNDPNDLLNKGGNGTQAQHIYTVPGKYPVHLNVISSNGCFADFYDTALVNAVPRANMGGYISDCVTEMSLNAGNHGMRNIEYLWNNGSTTQTILANESKIYTVKLTDTVSLCSSEEKIEVRLNALVYPNLGVDTTVCSSIILDAGYPGATYQWIDDTTLNKRTLVVNETGKYRVKVTSPSGCIGNDTVDVVISGIPSFTLGNDTSLCYGESISLSAAHTSGVDFLWSNGETSDNILVEASSNTFETKITGLEITDINNCKAYDNVKIEFNPMPELNLGEDFAVCEFKDTLVDALCIYGEKYLWNNGTKTSEIKINTDKSGKNQYIANVSNKMGCNSIDTIVISVLEKPVLNMVENHSVCCGDTIVLNAENKDFTAYLWSGGETDSELHITSLVPSTSIYQLKVFNEGLCSTISPFIYTEFKEKPRPLLPDSIVACGALMLDAGNQGASYLWDNNTTDQLREVIFTGTYMVKVTNGNGCNNFDTAYVVINNIEHPYLGRDFSLCKNETSELKTFIKDTACTYLWNDNSTGKSLKIATGGQYYVTLSHPNGCTDSDTVQVTSTEYPRVDLGADMVLCNKENSILYPNVEANIYLWGNSRGEINYLPSWEIADTGTYWVKVINANGCKNADTINIFPTESSVNPSFIAASELISGDSVQFIDMSEPNPISWYWNFGDHSTSTDQNPINVYLNCGDFKVTQFVSNGICTGSLVKNMTVICANNMLKETNEKINMEGFVAIEKVNIFPNPAQHRIWLTAELSNQSDIEIRLFHITGRMEFYDKVINTNSITREYNLNNLKPGIYIFLISAGTDYKSYKIIKY